MTRLLFIYGGSLSLLCCFVSTASAQGRLGSGTGSSSTGIFGTQSFGQGTSGGGSMFQSGATTQGLGSGGAGLGSGGGMGQSGFGLQGGSQQGMGQAGQQQGFVGRTPETMQQFFTNLQAGQSQFFQELGLGGRGNRDGGNQQQETPPVRITLNVGFSYPPPNEARLGLAIQDRLSRVLKRRFPSVEVTGRTVTLRGTVSTAHERELAEQLVRLEPGVSVVQNDLVVQAP